MTYVRTTQCNKSLTCICVPNGFYFVLWAKLAGRSVQNYEKWSFFSYFYPFESFSPGFWVIKGVTYIRIAQDKKGVTCSCVPKCFFFLLWVRLAGGSVHSYKKWSFFSIVSRLAYEWIAYIRIAWNDKSVTCSCVANEF